MNESNKQKLKKIFKHFGEETQLEWMMQECGEVVTAISKYRVGLIDKEKVLEEIADVLVVANQIRLAHDEVDPIIDEKINRTMDRIESGYYN